MQGIEGGGFGARESSEARVAEASSSPALWGSAGFDTAGEVARRGDGAGVVFGGGRGGFLKPSGRWPPLMARRGGALGMVCCVCGASRGRWHRDARGACTEPGRSRVAAESLTRGPPAALFQTARRVASPALWRGLCGDSAVQRGSWGGGASGGEVLGVGKAPNGDDHKVAAPPRADAGVDASWTCQDRHGPISLSSGLQKG